MANDDRNASDTFSFVVDVDNEAPEVLGSLSPLTVYDNISFTKTVNFSDYFQENDIGQTLHFSLSNTPSFITETKTGDVVTIQGNPNIHDINQNYTLQFVANDMYEQSSIDLIIEVLENKPPVAPHVTLPVSLLEGQQGTLTFPSYTDAEDDSITYT